MYGLPPTTDLRFLARKRLLRIEVNDFQVQLQFTDDVCISIESEVVVDGDARGREALRALVGAAIESVSAGSDGTLQLAFEGGRRVAVRDSNADYESYTITAPGVTIIV